MNLMKLFNFKYFIENLKKSRGLLAFFLGIVPLLNTIVLVILLINTGNYYVPFSDLSAITYVGLYIIPIVLAISLFGFVFKKKSVDFIMSKPISRKNLYFTNIIGGIFLLFCFIIINGLIFGLFSLFSPLSFPLALILDYLLFWFVSYVFVFAIASLAVCIAGNLIGSLVLVLLLALMYPFICLVTYYFETNQDTYIYIKDTSSVLEYNPCRSDDVACNKHLANQEYSLSGYKVNTFDFTTPTRVLNQNGELYDSKVIIKMAILIIIYIIFGYYFFINRKMENNETDFKNEKSHYFIKSLTFLPVCFFTYLLMKESYITGLIISLVIVLIYYIVYDLIARKEIYKFLKSSLVCIITFIIFNGVYLIGDIAFNNNQEYLIKDINSIQTTYDNFKVEDKELIKKLVQETIYNAPKNEYGSIFSANTDKGVFRIHLSYGSSTYKEVQDYLENKRYEEMKSLTKVDASDYPMNKELKNYIKEAINNYSQTNKGEDVSIIRVYRYQNHKFDAYEIPKGLSKSLDNYILEYNNKVMIKTLENNKIFYSFDAYGSDYLTDFDEYVFNYVMKNNIPEFINYLKIKNKEFKDGNLVLQVYGSKDGKVYIGSDKEFYEEFCKYKRAVEDMREYQMMVENYNLNKDVYEH